MSYRHCMRPNRSPFAFMHSYAGSPARPVRAQKKPAWRGRGKVYRMIKRFRFLRMCAPAPHNLPYIPTQNKSLHHAPHPAVVPVPYSHSHRRASPPAKPIRTAQAAIRLVGGHRPSMLQRWGSGVLPRRFPVALKALPEP